MDTAYDSVEQVISSPPPPATLRHAGFRHDPDVAVAALAAPPGARLLVVDACGGAEAAFAHLAADPAEVRVAARFQVEAVDALVALQRATFARLDRSRSLKLLGLLRASRGERSALYGLVEHDIHRAARAFWDEHTVALTSGIYSESAEARLGRLLRNLLIEHLTSADFRTLLYGGTEERLALFDLRIAASGFWRRALRLCALRGRVTAPADAAIDAFSQGDPMVALRGMVAVGLWSSPLWARAFCTDAGMLAALPAYLQPDGFETMAGRLDRLRGRVTSIDYALDEANRGSLDGVDLGALPDHLEPAALHRLLTRVVRLLRTDGRISYTQIHAEDVPAPVGLRRDHEVEARIAAFDRAPMTGARRVLVATEDAPSR